MTVRVRSVVLTQASLPFGDGTHFSLPGWYAVLLPKFLWILARLELAQWLTLLSLRAALSCLYWLLGARVNQNRSVLEIGKYKWPHEH